MGSVVDLIGVKSAIKSILDTANTTTASPHDLSANMSTRVQKVLTLHPVMIMPQASFYPFVTCYITDKNIISEDIAGAQITGKRKAEVMIDVIGGVWCNNVTDVTKDDGDDQLNYLMENVELCLRNTVAETMNGKILFNRPTKCTYYTSPMNEQNSVRAGILSLKATVYY